MKKLLPVLMFVLITASSFAQQCYTGPNNITPQISGIPGLTPPPDSLQCIAGGLYVSDTLYFTNFTTFSGVAVDSLSIDSIGNLPPGLCWNTNKVTNTFNGGESGAILISGTTTAAAGQYSLQIFITGYLAGGIVVGPDANANTLAGLYYWLRVSCLGGTCAALDTINGKTHSFIPYSGCTSIYDLSINGPTTVCKGSLNPYNVFTNSTSLVSYQWSDGETTQNINIVLDTTSTLYLTVTNDSGVVENDSIYIVVVPDPSAAFTLQPDSTPHVWDIVNQCTGTGLTYRWSWGDADTTITTSPTLSHTYDSAGYYTVCVLATDANHCAAGYCDTSTYLFKDQSGVIQLNVLQYPAGIATINESTQQISYYAGAVHFSEAVTAPASIRLYDMSGREVLSQDGFTGTVMPVNNTFSQGVYIIHLQNSSYSISRKLPILQ
jgi:hypothetical protein